MGECEAVLRVGLWENVRLRGCKEWFCEGVRLSNPSELGDCGYRHY